jgi:integrase
MVQVLLYTGLRRGELLGLEWTDIDFENKFLSVRRNSQYVPSKGVYNEDPKTAHSRRRIRISDNVVELLKSYKEWQDNNIENIGEKWENSNRLFTKWNGGPMHPDTISGWFHDFIKRKQLPDVCIHSLRHTNASLMVANGIPIKVVSDRLGHASVTTTSNFYLHMIQSADDVAANTLNDILSAG